jgi:hypothetical protein
MGDEGGKWREESSSGQKESAETGHAIPDLALKKLNPPAAALLRKNVNFLQNV